MPYRLNPNNRKQVQKQEGGVWILLKTHPTVEKAKKHLQALVLNVKSKFGS